MAIPTSVPPRPAFIYALRDPASRQIRYIGFSCRPAVARLREHLYTRQLARQTHKAHWLRQLVSQGLRPDMIILEETDTECGPARESYFIATYRAAGYDLTNITDGGDHASGYKMPPRPAEWRAKIAAATKGRPAHNKGKRGQSAHNKGKPMSAESRAKLSATKRGCPAHNRGKPMSTEHRAKLSAAMTGRRWTQEGRTKRAATKEQKLGQAGQLALFT